MRYLCLIYLDNTAVDRLTPEARQLLGKEGFEFEAQILTSSHYVASHTLSPEAGAFTVRVRGARTFIGDKPPTTEPEQLAAILIIEAKDFNDAIRIASQIPSARVGCIEVRTVQNL